MLSTRTSISLIGKPRRASRSIASLCVAANGSDNSPQPCAKKRSGRAAVTLGSFCRSDPAAAFRGLANNLPPATSCRSLSAAKSPLSIYTSPRTSSTAGAPTSTCGMSSIVRTLAVTSSPTLPSPRVAASTNTPSAYRREQDNPSIFGSAVSATSASVASDRNRRIRATNSATSSSEKALSRLSIGLACATLARLEVGAAPSRCDGESARTSVGNCASNARFSRTNASYSASAISGSSRS